MAVLRIILDRFDGDKAIFLTQEGQQLVWHRDDLPENVREGNTYFVKFAENESEAFSPEKAQPKKQKKEEVPVPVPSKGIVIDPKQRMLAKAMLEEMLNGSKP